LFPDFLNTLPAEWKVLPVSEACAFTAKPRSLDFSKYQELAFVPMDLIPTGRLHFSNFILKSPSEVTSGTYFEEGDLLVSKITPCFENGKQGIAHAIPNGFGIATTEVIPLKARDGLTHLPFIAYYLLHHEVRHLIAAAMEGATGRQRLPKDLLAQWPVPIPPIDEQRAIARLLETIQTAAQVEAAICDKLAALKSATMAKLFREGLRGEPLKQTEIGEIPESWEVTSLGQLSRENGGSIQTGPFGSQLHARDYRSEGVPVINPTHLEGNRISHTDVPRVSPEEADRLERHRVEVGDILFGRRGELGRHGLVSHAEAGWLCGTGCFLVRVRSPRVDNAFLSYFFSTEEVVKWLVSHAAGTIMPNLNNAVLGALPVALPEIREQRQIVQILDVVAKNQAIHNRKLALLETLFNTLLSQLMTGAIRVKDLDLAEVSHA